MNLARSDVCLPEFRFPDWDAPIDLAERLRRVPAEHAVKGIFIQQVLDEACAVSGRATVAGYYAPFEDYPMREWLVLLVHGAELTCPEAPVREGIRRMGQRAYGTLAGSIVGNVLLSVVGQDIRALLRLIPRIYRVTGQGGSASASFPAPNRALVHLRDVWDFPDAFHVGLHEGALRALGTSGQVKIRVIGQASVDLEIVWV
jgi:uncharacterized protein (TIGR02265 family)